MKVLLLSIGLGFALMDVAIASERSMLARVTVYWSGESGEQRASSNGVRLRNGHCAVDPKKIPFGSKVIFQDAECVAVDSGPDVISRKAARICAKSAAERDALVLDRFFETKAEAAAWTKAHPHFMRVRVVTDK